MSKIKYHKIKYFLKMGAAAHVAEKLLNKINGCVVTTVIFHFN